MQLLQWTQAALRLTAATAVLFTTMAVGIAEGVISDSSNSHARRDTSSQSGVPLSSISPKVMIISMFELEASVWHRNMPSTTFGSILARNFTTPGLSPRYPYIYCTENLVVCQVIIGESEINASATMTALGLSPLFDLRKTYFIVAGIAGISPRIGTQGSVVFSRYAVQPALAYEFDAREMPANFQTGYFGYGAKEPGEYPTILYGTEVFEVNERLRDAAMRVAQRAKLHDTPVHRSYGERYAGFGKGYEPAMRPPSIVAADSLTSDVYYSGKLLSEAFENATTLLTGGKAVYGVTAQEENATLEALLRMALARRVDFGRIIIMRTGSNFDRPPPGMSVFEHLVIVDQSGLDVATENIFRAGIEVIKDIVNEWVRTYDKGIEAHNYIGDIFGSLGGKPDFTPSGQEIKARVSKIRATKLHNERR